MLLHVCLRTTLYMAFNMKRILSLALAVILALSFTGCSEPEGQTISPVTITAAEFLAQFGLTEDDIKPEGFTGLDLISNEPDNGTVQIMADTFTPAQIRAWFRQIFNKQRAIADDRILHKTFPFAEEKLWDFQDGEFMPDFEVQNDWAYIYAGRTVGVFVVYNTHNYELTLFFKGDEAIS